MAEGDLINEKKSVEEQKEEVRVSHEPQYRYMCPACTGIAFYAANIGDQPEVAVCRNCGKGFSLVTTDRYIPLTDNEKEQLAALNK